MDTNPKKIYTSDEINAQITAANGLVAAAKKVCNEAQADLKKAETVVKEKKAMKDVFMAVYDLFRLKRDGNIPVYVEREILYILSDPPNEVPCMCFCSSWTWPDSARQSMELLRRCLGMRGAMRVVILITDDSNPQTEPERFRICHTPEQVAEVSHGCRRPQIPDLLEWRAYTPPTSSSPPPPFPLSQD
ncbi:hypothetical protein KBD61_04210 [Patescibacteria group bacterium]|nr:hypothetical protein [Patescibacteria group bacterium]MBP9710199.1 hypothetical protein [Patescibacteria group bacterium]